MPVAAALLTGIVVFWLSCCALTPVFQKERKHSYPAAALFLGGVAMFWAAILGWPLDVIWSAPAPIYLAVAPLEGHLDSLSSIFVGLLAIITIAISLFSPGYLAHLDKKVNYSCYWVELFLFVLSMLGLILAHNAVSFLVFWECVALTSVLLIASDLSNHQSRRAAFVYLGATRIATALLMAGFLWMYSIFQSWSFSHWHFSNQATILPAFLILIGLSIKSGIWPFHDWLPLAHPAAPSPVSALMSGVMIKVSLYAIIRILVIGGGLSPWLGYLMLTMGIISAFWGVVWALMQHDLKSLLAYHSIENVGLILVAIGLALVSQNLGLSIAAGTALSGAIFHCVNHGLFKSLLFLGAGTIDCRAHTRDLEKLGGLSKGLPWTAACFVLGSAAICALPPFNGFSSKWLVYQSFFLLAGGSRSLWLGALSMTCIAILGLVSGMALYCFTKAVGISFLGRPRSQAAERASEGSGAMVASQILLASCCVLLGICAPLAMAVIAPVCAMAFTRSADAASVYTIPMGPFALAVTALSCSIYFSWLKDGKAQIKRFVTWECGFGQLSGRMQATATSFAENVAHTFAPLFQYHRLSNIVGRDRRHFPEEVSLEVSTAPLLATRVYTPLVKWVRWLGEHMLLLQAGSIHLYLSYILLTLILLMVIGVLI